MKKILYFTPHQDEELLASGPDISKETKINSDNVYVYLCTDGSSSGVRRNLNDGNENCILHKGKHCYELDRKEFSKARNREFYLSLKALGVKKENIYIFPSVLRMEVLRSVKPCPWWKSSKHFPGRHWVFHNLEFSLKDFPELDIYTESFSEKSKHKVTEAAKAYNIWDHEKGFYTIGYHAVLSEFKNYLTFADMFFISKNR